MQDLPMKGQPMTRQLQNRRNRTHRALRRFAIAVFLCCVACAVAVAINPALAVVPAKIVLGGGVATRRVAVVAGTLDGEEIVYDAYRYVFDEGPDFRFDGLLLLLQSNSSRRYLFGQLLVRNDMIVLPNWADTVKLPFGFLLAENTTGVEIVSRKAFDNPVLTIDATNDVRRYRFCNRSNGSTIDTDLVLNIPNTAFHSSKQTP